jgi:hypothetical protein
MKHDFEHRDQLERLHDRHKRFTLEVYDHLTAKEEEKMLEAYAKMKEAKKELKIYRKKLFKK